MLLLFHAPFLFGYAKPVPVNFRALRSPRRDMVLVAAAGPVMNIALALVAALAFHIVDYLPGTSAEWLADNLKKQSFLMWCWRCSIYFRCRRWTAVEFGRHSAKACCYGRCASGALRSGDFNGPSDDLADVGGAQLGVNLNFISDTLAIATRAIINVIFTSQATASHNAPAHCETTITYLYGPAVCCKPDVSDGGIGLGLFCIRPVSRALVLLAIMDIRAHPLSFSKRP